MTIRDELLALKDQDGFITCQTAVAWARANKSSELYGALEWNDTQAAKEYRLLQVRHLIAIHIVNDEGERQMVSLSIDRSRDGGGYRDLDDVLPDKPLRQILLEDAFKELDRVQTKYIRLQELSAVWAEAEKAKKKAKKDPTKHRRKKGDEARPTA